MHIMSAMSSSLSMISALVLRSIIIALLPPTSSILLWTRVLIWYQLGFSLGLPPKRSFGWDGAS